MPKPRKPEGAPEGTVWFGGPIDRFKVTLRIFGDDLDPDEITRLMASDPTNAERKGLPVPLPDGGTRIPRRGRWSLTLDSKDCDENDDLEDGVRNLLARLPSEAALWKSLGERYKVDVFCAIFLGRTNQGFGISAEISKMLADRCLDIGFDIYFEPET